jgi:hypothetical protein
LENPAARQTEGEFTQRISSMPPKIPNILGASSRLGRRAKIPAVLVAVERFKGEVERLAVVVGDFSNEKTIS